MGRVRGMSAALDARSDLEGIGRPVVTTNGCFDLIHRGHVELLRYASGLGYLIVLVNCDRRVRELKGPGRPIIPLMDRMFVLASVEYVGMVVPFDEDTPVNALKALKPDFHVKGGEYGRSTMPEWEVVESWGGQIRQYPNTGVSTSGIIRHIIHFCARDDKPAPAITVTKLEV